MFTGTGWTFARVRATGRHVNAPGTAKSHLVRFKALSSR
jgi:hypothetical protein